MALHGKQLLSHITILMLLLLLRLLLLLPQELAPFTKSKYVHTPTVFAVNEPEHGVPLVCRRLYSIVIQQIRRERSGAVRGGDNLWRGGTAASGERAIAYTVANSHSNHSTKRVRIVPELLKRQKHLATMVHSANRHYSLNYFFEQV